MDEVVIRTVLLIRSAPPLHYFANRLREACEVQLVVVERGRAPRRRLPRSPIALARKVVSAVASRATAVAARAAEQATHDRLFGDQWRALHASLPVLEVDDVNDPSVLEHVRRLGPELLFDHGTSLVGPELIGAAPLALNLHWGLSPWYRGVRCTEWALIHWDPYYIGVTIHHLARRIDGGEIVAQGRLAISPSDTVHSINMGLTRLGTDLAVDIVGRLARGEALAATPQDHQLGLVTSSRSWSPDLDRHMERLLREGSIARMLARPMRR